MATPASDRPEDPPRSVSAPLQRSEISDVYSLEELFAIPLKAIIDANAYAARVALDLILQFGFNPGVQGSAEANRALGTLRMASFVYDYVDEKGRKMTMEVSIPMLSLIPIPMLEVRSAEFDYAVKIISQNTDYDSSIGMASVNASHHDEHPRRKLMALMAPLESTRETSSTRTAILDVQANMAVKVQMEKADLPAGILQLLNLGQECIRSHSEPPLILFASPAMLDFAADPQPKIQINVGRIYPPGEKADPVANLDVQITVRVRSGPAADELFSLPIAIVEGNVVGTPSKTKATALTNSDGLVVFRLAVKLRPAPGAPEANGFVIIRATGAPEQRIYFSFK